MLVGGAKMSETRRRLGSLASDMNVGGGEEFLRTRVPKERTHVERQAEVMYERGEETWRRLTRRRVDAFVELFLIAMVRTENGHREGQPDPQSVEMLLETLVERIIPWVYRHRVWSKFQRRWPMSLEHFYELDNDLTNHLPRIHRGYQWQMIAKYYRNMEEELRRWEEQELTEEANERNYLQWKNSTEYNLSYTNDDDDDDD